MTEHVVPVRVYITVFLILMVMTALTVTASEIDLGKLNPIVAITIAIVKALLVILYFMHVRYSSKLTAVVVATGFFWLVVMIVLTLSDVLTRGWLGFPGG
jgi:cytochrome c oxidase subunit 4